jgi:hypothetical protein
MTDAVDDITTIRERRLVFPGTLIILNTVLRSIAGKKTTHS